MVARNRAIHKGFRLEDRQLDRLVNELVRNVNDLRKQLNDLRGEYDETDSSFTMDYFLLLEDGTELLLEDGESHIIIYSEENPDVDFLILE